MEKSGQFDATICSMKMEKADHNARIGKTHRNGINWFDRNRDENLLKLQRDLREGTYKTSPYKTFKVYDPKERNISSLPYYPDRICHHAVMGVIEPILVRSFIKQTYSCIGQGLPPRCEGCY